MDRLQRQSRLKLNDASSGADFDFDERLRTGLQIRQIHMSPLRGTGRGLGNDVRDPNVLRNVQINRSTRRINSADVFNHEQVEVRVVGLHKRIANDDLWRSGTFDRPLHWQLNRLLYWLLNRLLYWLLYWPLNGLLYWSLNRLLYPIGRTIFRAKFL